MLGEQKTPTLFPPLVTTYTLTTLLKSRQPDTQKSSVKNTSTLPTPCKTFSKILNSRTSKPQTSTGVTRETAMLPESKEAANLAGLSQLSLSTKSATPLSTESRTMLPSSSASLAAKETAAELSRVFATEVVLHTTDSLL